MLRPIRPREPIAPPIAPLEVPGRWLALAVPFNALGRNGERWRALRLQHQLCGLSLHQDGSLVAIGDD